MFSGKTQVPCVGISFGIDRIFSIIQATQKKKERRNEVDVFVMAFGSGKDFSGLLKERSQVCARLWDAGIKVCFIPSSIQRQPKANGGQAEFLYKVRPKLQNQFKAAEANGVPFALILGEVCSSGSQFSCAIRYLTLHNRTNWPKEKRGSRKWVSPRTTH